MISRRMNQCVFWMMMFVCGVSAVQLGAWPPPPPEVPACGNSCQLISLFETDTVNPTSVFAFAGSSGGCLRIWVDAPNAMDPKGNIVPKTAYEREDPICAKVCPAGTTGDIVLSCTYVGTADTHFLERNCYVDAAGVTAGCVPQ